MRVEKHQYINIPRQKPSFNGVLHIDPGTGNINDSWFNRDINTLETAAENITMDFPKGADVLIYGCSTGEENISLKALLPDSRYRIIGYDTSADALRIGKRGVYSLFSNWYDSYLLPNAPESVFDGVSKSQRKKMLDLREKFHDMMYEVPACNEYRDINNKTGYTGMKYSYPNFIEKFYSLRSNFRSQIDLRLGNFMKVGQVRKERPVGGIFFRNAIYHLCNNNINEVLSYNETPGRFANKQLLMENLVNGVHKTLDKGGVFVIGNHIKEHLYLADETVPPENTVNFCDTPFYVETNQHHRSHKYLRCCKDSPLLQALLKDGRFEPIGFSEVVSYNCRVKVPVMFKKIR